MLNFSSRPSPYQVIFVAGELLMMGLAVLMALYIRLPDPTQEIFTWKYSWERVILVPIVLQVTFYYFDLNNFRIARPFLWTVTRVAQAVAVGTLALAVIYYLFPRLFLGRGVLVINFFTTFTLVVLWRWLYAWALRHHIFATRVLLVGAGSLADSILEEIVSRSDNAYNLVCILCPDGGGEEESRDATLMEAWSGLLKADLRRDPSEMVGLVRHHHTELVVVALDEKRGRMPMNELLRCRMMGVPVMSGEEFFESMAGRILADRINTSWLVFSPGFTTTGLRRFSKRTFDVLVSLVGLVLAAPLIAFAAAAVRLSSPGPVIFRQERVGEHEQVFVMYKFRTMVAGAEDASGPVWAAENDQRVTRLGRLLRRTRLDETPQLWNVLKGDMSFVGPRPERPHFVQQLAERLPFYSERHNVKPGVTGWAQICYPYGASAAASLEKLNYDLYYIKHSNLSMDILILLQTVKLLLFGGGGR
jgi:sugar transferase (PEP-CTERM system associated)